MNIFIGWIIFFSLWALGDAIGVPAVGIGFGAFIGYKVGSNDHNAPEAKNNADDDDDNSGGSSKAKRVARAGGAFAVGYLAGKKTGV